MQEMYKLRYRNNGRHVLELKTSRKDGFYICNTVINKSLSVPLPNLFK